MPAGLRIRRSQIQTAVRSYHRRDDGRRVHLVATSHIGQASYYTDLRAAIAALEGTGAVVHCEGSHRQLPDDLTDPDLTEEQVQVLDDLYRADTLSRERAAEVFGWASQRDALGWGNAWQNHDLGLLQLIRLAGVDHMRRLAATQRGALDWTEGDAKAVFRYRLDTVRSFRLVASRWPGVQRLLASKAHPIVVRHRCQVALHNLHATSQDVVMVWGAGHLPTMDNDLRAHGYAHTGVTWHTVGRLSAITSDLDGRDRTAAHQDLGRP